MNPKFWLRVRRIRRAAGVTIAPATMGCFPADLRAKIMGAGWTLMVLSEHGIRQWRSPSGEFVTLGADCVERDQVQYLYDVLSGKRERRVPGALADVDLATLLALDADTILNGDMHVDR